MSHEIDSEFLDARPETKRHPQSNTSRMAAQDALMGGQEEQDDDLVFYDAAADSGLDIQVIAPPRKTDRQKKRPSSGSGRIPRSPSESGRHQAMREKSSSGSHRIHRVSSTRTAAQAAEWERRARSMEDQQAAYAKVVQTAQRTPQGDVWMGRELGPFKVERFLYIDRGLRYYMAIDEETEDPALLRIYPLKGSYADEFKALVERGERACRVQSPSMSVCIGAGRNKECFFVGHELPMGETLEELQATGHAFTEDEVFQIIEQVSQGLKVLHARQLVHGDVSLGTIRREKPGVWVLTDAGLGRSSPEFDFLAAGGEVVGSPGFIAPEEVDSGKGEPQGDIYALGCVAWTLIAGRRPFEGADAVQLLLDQLNNEIPNLVDIEGVQVSDSGATIIRKLCGYTINTRYRSVSDLLIDMRSRQKGETVKPFPSDMRDRSDPGAQPEKPVTAGNLLLVLLLLLDVALVGTVVLTWAKTQQIRLEDPIPGYELPLPGVSEGGYGRSTPEPAGRSDGGSGDEGSEPAD